MSSATAQTQAHLVGPAKAQEEMDEEDMGTTDVDTSSWESEPHTARSSRKYHPVKGEHTAVVSEDEDDDREPLTNGGAPENPALVDQKLLSSQYLRKTFGLGLQGTTKDDEQSGETRVRETTEDTGVRNGYERDGQSASDAGQEVSEIEGDDSLKRHPRDTEDIIEEIDLTREPKPSVFGRGAPGTTQTKFVFVPSLGPFGSSPFGSLMTGLLSSDGDGFENDADVSSQSEAEEVTPRLPRVPPPWASPGTDGRSQQEKWEHLFGMLEQQHRQQVVLQREHHERQVGLLQAQLASLGQEQEDLVSKQHQEPLGRHPEDARRQPRKSPNGRDRDAASPSPTPPESSQGHARSLSGDSEATLEGSLADASETLMTTWSDVVEQKQADKEVARASAQEEVPERIERREGNRQEPDMPRSRGEDDRFVTLQKHFAQQQQQLQAQYALQVKHMQQQWSELQSQQEQQQEVLRHILGRQQERITQTHRDMQGVRHRHKGQEPGEEPDSMEEDRTTPTSDTTSTAYSDFAYWKQAEQDTYRALPDVPAEDAARGQERQQPETAAAMRSPNRNVPGSPDHAVQWPPAGPGQRSPHLSGQSSSPRRSADDGNTGEDAQLSSSLRLNLREKHARHIADLKAYYDSEIQDLQSKLTEAASLRGHSPDKVTRRTNQRLQDNCVRLEAALKSANSRIEDLENTAKALESRLGETYTSTDSAVTSLEQKVNDLKQLCRHKELDVQSLEKRNRDLQASLDQAYQLQDVQAVDEHRDQKILKKVLNEYKALAKKHEITKDLLHDTETQLYESKAKIADLSRTLSNLEFEVKRMDLENSVGKRQSLPQSSSGTSLRSRTGPDTASTTTPAADTSPDDRCAREHARAPGLGAKDTNGPPAATAVNCSVEERKFLRPSTDYNILTGEKLGTESGSESLQFVFDTESSLTQSEDNRPDLSALGRCSDLGVAFDPNTDEERPLSPMMKAARQMDTWKAEESTNAGDDRALLSNGLSGTQATETPDDVLARSSTERRHNRSANNSGRLGGDAQPARGRLDGGPLSQDSSIHIWPASDKGTQRSAASPASNVGAALALSSPKQLARQSLAKAIKPRDHDIFPVSAADGSPRESSALASPAAARQSSQRAPFSGSSRKSKEPRRRQLFVTKSAKRGLEKGESVADSVLAKLRAGDVQTRADWEGLGSSNGQRRPSPKKQTETSLDIVHRINDHQKKLDQLMMEKRQLETTLSHVPISGRVSRQTRQDEERLEQRLKHVTQELGSVRMLLRKYSALKSSI